MNWEDFKSQFHESWHDKIRPFIESEDCDKIYAFLKKESKRGKRIAPISSLTFRAFQDTTYDNLKVVLMGMAPYHTFRNGYPIADGLLMGCSVTEKLQPSLSQFYNALEKDLYNGLNLGMIKDPDLSYLANQGVLLFNASLTTEMNKPGSHLSIWEPFTKFVLMNVIDTTGAPIVFLGKEAAKFKRFAPPFTYTFEISHPASAAYSGTDWDSEGTFTKVNKIIKGNNNYEINWVKS